MLHFLPNSNLRSDTLLHIAASVIPSGTVQMAIDRRTTGATIYLTLYWPRLARAHAELGQFEEAWRCIGEAMTAVETTKEKWWDAEVHRVAGEIALKSPEPDATKAQAYFERAIAIARAQQAKSWSCGRRRAWRCYCAIRASG
jgi:predicted ATPase